MTVRIPHGYGVGAGPGVNVGLTNSREKESHGEMSFTDEIDQPLLIQDGLTGKIPPTIVAGQVFFRGTNIHHRT
jgi:hypothetical protein